MKKKCQKYNIIQMLKITLFSHIFKHFPFKMYLQNVPSKCTFKMYLQNVPSKCTFKMYLQNVPSKCTFKMYLPCGVFIIPQKNILATFIVSLLVYISQMFLLSFRS